MPGVLEGPTDKALAFSVIRDTILSYTSETTTALEHAEHFWPWNPKAEATTAEAASSRFASESTIIAFLPPNSRAALLIHF
ncbi:hypothetical protein SDC9_189764 [bioreactor metagenome]|uniref:Uncharacterized protein n=1 Tax=bioreactor metagenome TaxID=1076179 RepID=A0A645HT33_9ZZZZ